MADDLPKKTWLESIITGPTLVTLMIALVGQAVLATVFQIRNNDQQEAAIQSNTSAIHAFESNVVNMQTPLGVFVTKIDGRLSSLEGSYKTLENRLSASDTSVASRIENIDRGGTRAMDSVLSTQQRLSQMSDRLAERLVTLDQRMNDLQTRMTLYTEVVNRNDKLTDIMFTYLRQHSTFSSEQVPKDLLKEQKK